MAEDLRKDYHAALVKLVRAAMTRAKENGEVFERWTPQEIANDLLEYDADFDGIEPVDVERAVATVLLGDK